MNSKHLPFLVTTLATVFACGDGGDAQTGGGGSALEDPAADACEHLATGPFVDVAASDMATGAPDVSAEHTVHRVTLGGAPLAGYVSFGATEASEVSFYTDEVVTLTLEDSSGATLDWETACTSDCTSACAEVATGYTIDLSSVGTYALRMESPGP